MNRLLTLMLLLLLVGCAAQPRQLYPGERLSPEKEARVSTDSEDVYGAIAPGFDRKIYLVRINGESLSDTKALLGGQLHPYPTEAYVLPGRQELDVRYVHLNQYADGRVWFDAQAGKVYRVRYRISGYGVVFWVEDTAQGVPVGGLLE
ncbi:MAG: hypothetical protein L6Q65_16170 [Zoogloea sp.]|nr:hypothetical protein [Zoogloea sp.]MCK6389115.1 hypothetical protein [Zoogloea sp.]